MGRDGQKGRSNKSYSLFLFKKLTSENHFTRFNEFRIISKTNIFKYFSSFDIVCSLHFKIFYCDNTISVGEGISIRILYFMCSSIFFIEKPREVFFLFCHVCIAHFYKNIYYAEIEKSKKILTLRYYVYTSYYTQYIS